MMHARAFVYLSISCSGNYLSAVGSKELLFILSFNIFADILQQNGCTITISLCSPYNFYASTVAKFGYYYCSFG
jgi:hypothetical protein